MKKNCCRSFAERIVMVLPLLSILNSQLSTVFAQGSLTPSGPPAPGMKTLQQIEPRSPISALPLTITNSGSYYLTATFSNAVGDAITVDADDVTIDLNGFALIGGPFSSSAVYVPSDHRHITVRNGSVRG